MTVPQDSNARNDSTPLRSVHGIALSRLALALLCGVVGFGINSLPLGAIAPLLLGRVATLPIAILFGPWYGALAAGVASLTSRNASTAVVVITVLCIEGLCVGLMSR